MAKLIETSTEGVLAEQSITLDGELDCTADISVIQGTVTGSCTGTDTDGDAITSTLDATATVVGVNSCSGSFIVKKAATVLNDDPNFNCFL